MKRDNVLFHSELFKIEFKMSYGGCNLTCGSSCMLMSSMLVNVGDPWSCDVTRSIHLTRYILEAFKKER